MNASDRGGSHVSGGRSLTLAVLAIVVGCALPSKTWAQQTWNETVLFNFDGTDGQWPTASVIQDSLGNFYGSTSLGGTYGSGGTVFELQSNGTENVLYAFPKNSSPYGRLVRDSKGNLYGTTSGGCGTVFKVTPGGKERTLYSFTCGTDGWLPSGGLVLDSEGNLYGTTVIGGIAGCGLDGDGCGLVFKLSPGGTETVLHSFTAGTDGAVPTGDLVRDSAGNLYGMTANGGGGGLCGFTNDGGCGTVYKVDPTGVETVLYRFSGGTDGAVPDAGLNRDTAGNFYGTTNTGGNLACPFVFGCGTVFKLDPTGVETVLYAFNAGSDGGFPNSGLVRDSAGNLYGTSPGNPYYGTASPLVFEVSPDGAEMVLFTFTNISEGSYPNPGLLRDGAGNLYGTTPGGGRKGCIKAGCGVVFKLSPPTR